MKKTGCNDQVWVEKKLAAKATSLLQVQEVYQDDESRLTSFFMQSTFLKCGDKTKLQKVNKTGT